MEHFVAGLPVVLDESKTFTVLESGESPRAYDLNDPIIKQIVEIIDTRVRPAVAQDGGDISFDRFEEGVVFLKLQGACSGCPSSTATLKSGIENMLRYYVPEVLEVRAA
jgi:Fe-S cluster biogenesis protein NfuA